ncbi:MAG: 30S ribosomal protein S8 [Chloroflexi bacterium]|jgi:small subunit ribosomal protein S8|nr:30S ribosomal protein S8 [Chloroflexota bacterium]MBT7081942.1 30S ribosomal protein S8 [Chloroflexota bacterium]MBT7290512.1 30S ribosomal protein S8 [Chloroflexota bacterium]
MNTDPIADMLTRIRNAVMAKHNSVVMPASKIKGEIGSILKNEGFVKNCIVEPKKPQGVIKIGLKYDEKGNAPIVGLKRVSKPGLRVYTSNDKVPSVYGGIGISIVSTSQGIMTGKEAKRKGVGGEVLCYVW